MIYDRTIKDVENAKKIRLEKVQKFLELTDEDVQILERGFVTVNTLNRIEQKQSELKSAINSMGYYGANIQNYTWGRWDYFEKSDLQRICENTRILREAFFDYVDTPENPMPRYYFEEFNKLEKILLDIENMVGEVQANYKICGTFNCGG